MSNVETLGVKKNTAQLVLVAESSDESAANIPQMNETFRPAPAKPHESDWV
jgi:hypothetical protein